MMKSVLKKGARGLFELIQSFVVAGAIFVVVYFLLFQPHQVKGASMQPNFLNGEYILTEKVSYRFGEPLRGDVIVFQSPKSERVDFIKRVIGLPGETVAIVNGRFAINGRILKETYLSNGLMTRGGGFLPDGGEILVPADHFFVAGDNRGASSDSREWGLTEKNNIVGRAFLRHWPLDRIGLIPRVEYPENQGE